MREFATVLIGRSFSSWTVLGLRVQIDVVFELVHLGCSGGQNQILLSGRFSTSVGDSPFACSKPGSDSTITWRCFAAVGKGNGGAGNGDQLGAQEVQGDIVELRFGQVRCPRAPSCRIGTLEAL